MQPSIHHKRSATFSYSGLVTLPAGVWTASSSLDSQGGARVADLAVTLTPLPAPGANGETHALLLECPAAATVTWPHGTLIGDILFIDADGVTIASETFSVAVEPGVTSA